MSLTRQEGYKTFSEWFRHHFGDKYAVDKTGAMYCTDKKELV